ncbi:MAG TPA: hypothetical protein VIK18_20710 [Pirellulales bacterium]
MGLFDPFSGGTPGRFVLFDSIVSHAAIEPKSVHFAHSLFFLQT